MAHVSADTGIRKLTSNQKRFALALFCSALLHIGLLSIKSGGYVGGATIPDKPLQVSFAHPIPPSALDNHIEAVPTAPFPKTKPSATSSTGLIPEVPAETDRYYLSSEVDVRAEPLKMEPLVYPEQAYQMRIFGKVRLRVYINEEGNIDSIDVVEATPPGVFEDAALKALLATKFSAALKNGNKVKNQKLMEINFDPYENITDLPDK